jgi:hypothetical protein
MEQRPPDLMIIKLTINKVMQEHSKQMISQMMINNLMQDPINQMINRAVMIKVMQELNKMMISQIQGFRKAMIMINQMLDLKTVKMMINLMLDPNKVMKINQTRELKTVEMINQMLDPNKVMTINQTQELKTVEMINRTQALKTVEMINQTQELKIVEMINLMLVPITMEVMIKIIKVMQENLEEKVMVTEIGPIYCRRFFISKRSIFFLFKSLIILNLILNLCSREEISVMISKESRILNKLSLV